MSTQITLYFILKPQNIKPETSNNDFFISRKIVWDDSKVNLFHSQLMNNNESLQWLIRDVSTEPIDHMVQDFTRFLHNNAFDVFGQTFHSKSRSMPCKKVKTNGSTIIVEWQKKDFETA